MQHIFQISMLAYALLFVGPDGPPFTQSALKGSVRWTVLASLPPQEAKKRFLQLKPTEMRDVWLAKLNAIHLDRLSADQAAVIRDGIGLLNSLAFDGTDNEKYGEQLIEFSKRTVEVFDKDEARIIFSTLLSYEVWKSNAQLPDCDCSTTTDFCGRRWICCEGCVSCRPSWIGCGLFWAQDCNGRCIELR